MLLLLCHCRCRCRCCFFMTTMVAIIFVIISSTSFLGSSFGLFGGSRIAGAPSPAANNSNNNVQQVNEISDLKKQLEQLKQQLAKETDNSKQLQEKVMSLLSLLLLLLSSFASCHVIWLMFCAIFSCEKKPKQRNSLSNNNHIRTTAHRPLDLLHCPRPHRRHTHPPLLLLLGTKWVLAVAIVVRHNKLEFPGVLCLLVQVQHWKTNLGILITHTHHYNTHTSFPQTT